jgi:hypothetical protein
MAKICILLSGHLRNCEDIIINFKKNLLDVISTKYNYDIYIHTWDDNKTNDIIYNQDKYFKKNIIDIELLLKNNNIKVKKILIENQDNKTKEFDLESYLDIASKNEYFQGRHNDKELRDLIKKLFWQFYGHQKVFNLIDNLKEYSHIIKTRPDIYYEEFDLSLLDQNAFFPNSHLFNNICINQIFFGGKTEYMEKILNYFSTIIYKNNVIDNTIVSKWNKKRISFNSIFRYYIIDYLKIKPFFCEYNPKIYRDKKNIVTIK